MLHEGVRERWVNNQGSFNYLRETNILVFLDQILKDHVLLATFLQTSVFEWSPVKENDREAAEMKSLNSPKSHRLLDFAPSIRPSFLSVMLVFVCGCLWVKNETTNERLIALQSRIDYLPCVKRVLFERMTRSSTKVTSNDLHKNLKMRTRFSGVITHTPGKMLTS